MSLEELRVIHFKKGETVARESSAAALSGTFLAGSFVMDSCLRRIWVCSTSWLEAVELPVGAELFKGAQAYAFLVSVACGLESVVAGETDVFGQFKQAWKSFEQSETSDGDLRTVLAPWIPRIFEDTKEIRAQYLQNLGGSSYGSLLRKLMREQPGGSSEPVLLVGAGQLALSVAPYLAEFELRLTNRRPERLAAIHDELIAKPGARVRVLRTGSEVADAWVTSAQAVICVPYDREHDSALIEAWRKGGESRPIYHLGETNADGEPWRALSGYRSLEDLFRVEQSQGKVRSAQLVLARRACEEKSKLRALGGSLSIAHGWEDLALFA